MPPTGMIAAVMIAWVPNRILVELPKYPGGERSIIQLCTTGRMANRKKPASATTVMMARSPRNGAISATIQALNTRPQRITGRLPTRSDHVPAIGAAMRPPICSDIMTRPIQMAPVRNSLIKYSGRKR